MADFHKTPGATVKRTSAPLENSRLLDLVAAVVIIAILYFARVVFIPLALALLFSLLLTPPVAFLERIRLPRFLAIIFVVLILAGLLSFMGWKTSRQFIDVMNRIPAYQDTILGKIQSFKGNAGQTLNNASASVKALGKEIVANAPGAALTNETDTKFRSLGTSPAQPLAVQVVPAANPIESLHNILGPLGTALLVTVFTLFILLGREDLRNRFIRLAGGGQLNVMTQALDEATHRINRYLFLQLLVNSGYGAVIGTGLYFIGIPNASLWGFSTAILRFLPYVGTPLAALGPMILSLAVLPGWHGALLTAGLFLVVELTIANILEPLLYGAHVGLSPFAILVAAIFWTLIWGFPGLVLSTPLTVCLVVLGRYVPHLSFLNVLFGDEPVLPPHTKFYQRLLAADQTEARQILEAYLKEKPVEELYGSVIIPALGLAEQDRHRNELDEARQNFIYQSTRELIEELGEGTEQVPEETTIVHASRVGRNGSENGGGLEVLCIPARDEADEIVGMLVARALERHGITARSIAIGTTAEMLSQVAELKPAVVCLSALPPFAVDHARALYLKLRAQFPGLEMVVCLWHYDGDLQKVLARLKLANGHALFTTLPDVLQHIAFRVKEGVQAGSPK